MSTISSISPTAALQTPAKPSTVEAAEATRSSRDVSPDGDGDDVTGAAAARASASTTNSLGQTIGKNLNVSA